MTGKELRQRRRALGLSQAEFAERVGLSRDYIGQMERDKRPINERTKAAALAVKPRAVDIIGKLMRLHDPLEQIIYDALIDAGIRFVTDEGGGTSHRLDFHLTDYDIAIEVKRFHTPRIADQTSRVTNVIVAQGEAAVRFLAAAISSGDFLDLAHCPSDADNNYMETKMGHIDWVPIEDIAFSVKGSGSDLLLWVGDHAEVGYWSDSGEHAGKWLNSEGQVVCPTHFAELNEPD